MAPSVKLAVICKTGEEASLLRKSACLSSSSLTLVEKQPYLVSTSSYKLSVKVLHSSRVSDSIGVYKNHVRQNSR